jgi:ribonuclease HI
MKTLKLDHNLAQMVLRGEKTSTWRLYDDKDLSVNDQVRIIDKIDPERPETWKVIGVAQINTVVQKRLADITEADYDGHDRFESHNDMLQSFRHYYGRQVDFDTPVKIIRFSFNNSIDHQEVTSIETIPKLMEVKLFGDGGSRGNPGPSASGFVIMDMQDAVVVKKSLYIGVTTNNQAEYTALKLGLEEAIRMGVRIVHVYMDSLLVINQMLGIFKVKNRDLWPVHTAIKDLILKFEKVTFVHIPRELNKLADAAVNEALDEAAKT